MSRDGALRVETRLSGDAPLAGETLRLTTWNLGYAGLGAESAFITDGGRQILPPSRRAVDKNVRLITAYLMAEAADLLLLQEAARQGPMTLWRDLLGRIDAALPDADRWFHADTRTWAPPPPLGLAHGLACVSRRAVSQAGAQPLPSDDKPLVAGIRRRFALMRLDLPLEEPSAARGWTVINLHFSAFDAQAALRRRQLDAALTEARRAYADGRAVVLGGDWNLSLAETNFPHSTPSRCTAWLHPYPHEATPAGWRVVCDPRTPTVRTTNQPYREGENMRAVIDGFLISPNVDVVACETVDLGFEPSDHHPVRATLRLKTT